MAVSDEDKALFSEMMKTVKPLKDTTKREPKPPVAKKISIRKSDPIEKPKTEYYLSNYYTDAVHSNSELSYTNQAIPRKRLRELKNGDIRWEARLDLHGFRPEEAQRALCDFIEQKYHAGNRCLLIIHGKGGRLGEEPVLKNHVNHWLKQLPYVLAFNSAIPRDGGNGALYVLLKRQRENNFD